MATHAAEKVIQLGGKVLTLSDSGGFIHDPDGIDADRLDVQGLGETTPIDDNESPEGRQNNRRVELVRLDG